MRVPKQDPNGWSEGVVIIKGMQHEKEVRKDREVRRPGLVVERDVLHGCAQ